MNHAPDEYYWLHAVIDGREYCLHCGESRPTSLPDSPPLPGPVPPGFAADNDGCGPATHSARTTARSSAGEPEGRLRDHH